MGFDKPDLGFVVHLGAPSSPVAYYQQVGRAGRASESADVLLLPGNEDPAIWHYFATASMPDEERARRVIDELSDEPLSTPALEARVDIRRTPLELLLKVLDVDGAVRRVQGGWVATGEPWAYDAERYGRIAAEREAEQQHMVEYEQTDGCRMEFLQRSLDDETATPVRPLRQLRRRLVSAATSTRARRTRPRARSTAWACRSSRAAPGRPAPIGSASPVKGRIAPGEQADEGRALARLTDLGWGGTLRELFAAGLARCARDAAGARGLRSRARRLGLGRAAGGRGRDAVAIPSAARRLARPRARGGRTPPLPRRARRPSAAARPGSPAATARSGSPGVWERFSADGLDVPSGGVLLVDDQADSRWTLTVAARTLRGAGATEVLPFVLALRG